MQNAICVAVATLDIMITMTIATINPNIQGGVPCFTGTRVPVVALFDFLDRGYCVGHFLSDFPTVTEFQAHALLDQARANVLEHWQQNL